MVIKYTYCYLCLEKKSEQIITLLLIIINYFSPRSSVGSYFQSYTDFTFHYLCWLEVVRICFFFLWALILHLHVIGIDSITEKKLRLVASIPQPKKPCSIKLFKVWSSNH